LGKSRYTPIRSLEKVNSRGVIRLAEVRRWLEGGKDSISTSKDGQGAFRKGRRGVRMQLMPRARQGCEEERAGSKSPIVGKSFGEGDG